MTRVSVVIVSYEVRELLRTCLASVRAQRGVEVETWVIDNASRDGSADMVAAAFPEVHLLRRDDNRGFAFASNRGLERATGELLLLLNPDTELPDGALQQLCEVWRRHPEAGAIGLALAGADRRPQPSCHAFPSLGNLVLESLGLHRAALRLGIGSVIEAPAPRGGEGAVDWVAGACMALTRAGYARVGGLDESTFMYGEEMDWCWRARAAGFATVWSDAARVVHHGQASSEGMHGPLFVRNVQARIGFMRRYRGPVQAAIARESIALGSLLRFLLWRTRALTERPAPSQRTRDQLDRFGAVLAWRWGAAR